MSDLQGNVALVTGASRGIGRAVAHTLAGVGVKVAVAARSAGAVAEVADEIRRDGGEALPLTCDVANFREVEAAVNQTVAAFGRLDILVNNAGIIDPIARLAEGDPTVWGRSIDINIKGVYHGMRAALPLMERQSSGTIVNMSSGAANSALEGWSHYCAGKAAVKKLTECAHGEVAERGVRVVGLSPGTVATDMMSTIKQSGINPVSQLDWSTHIPPQWVGEAVLFLCGPGGVDFAGTDFSIKTEEGRRLVGLPLA